MFLANEYKNICTNKYQDHAKIYFQNTIIESVNKVLIDETEMFNPEDFSIHFFDEFETKTNTCDVTYITAYLEINQPNNYKIDTKKKKPNPKKKADDRVKAPNLYLTLKYIKDTLMDELLLHYDNNTLFWQDRYSVRMKMVAMFDEDKADTFYLRLIPCLSYTNKNKEHGVLYYNNDNKLVEITYPELMLKNFNKKNKATKDLYRQYVVMFKNIYLKNSDTQDLPPEMFETILYNVPNELYTDDKHQSILKVLNYLRNVNMKNFKTIDEQEYVFTSEYKSLSVLYAKHVIKVIEKAIK